MKKLLLALVLVSAVGLAFADTADTIQPYDGSTAYINVNTGWASIHNLPTGSWAGSVNAGYNLMLRTDVHDCVKLRLI